MATEAIELMLADLRWTRRLAVTLARDHAEADDLWSETWAAARREHKPVQRGWIATTMRNVVRMSRRTEKRRLAREIASADLAAAAHTPEELLARVELQKTLTELVTGLGEPYRTTLLLHHVEDLAPVEIARRLAIPAGTVRWRLKVAHDELRDRLIDRSGGDRDAWRLALVPLLPGGFQWPSDAGAQRPGQTAPAKGGTTMMTWKLLALLGATMAVSGTVLHAGHDATKTAGTSTRPKAAGATTGGPTAPLNGAFAANTPAGTVGKGADTGRAAKPVPPANGKCDDCVHRRAFAVPSAAIADFEAPDLDACFAAVPRSPTYKRIDLSLALKREGATAAIKSVAPKFVSDELAHTPGLVDCLKRTLVERDMPAPGASGPAELAILVSDNQHLNLEPGPAPGGTINPDGQAPSLGWVL
jgi:RNA polymerase sigma factor (sigma-70 family)